MKETKKNITYKRGPLLAALTAVFFVIALLFLVKYQKDHSTLRQVDVAGIEAPSEEFLCGVDDCKRTEENFVEVSCWALKQGEDIDSNEAYILLQDTDTGAFYRMPTAVTDRADVAGSFEGDYDYLRCGLFSAVKYSCLPQHFRIFIHYQNNRNNVLMDTTNVVSKEDL